MTTQRVFTSRSQHSATTYVGSKGQLFYNELTGNLRLSDGHTAGGLPISISANIVTTESIVPDTDNIYGIGTNLLRWNHLHIGDGGIYFDGNQTSQAQTVPYIPGAISTDIIPAVTNNSLHLGNSTHRWGDVWIGKASLNMQDEVTGDNVAFTVNSGTLYLNGVANLAIGQLTIVGNTIQSDIPTRNINLGDPNDSGLFTVGRQTVITTPNLGAFTSALLINGATTLPVDPSPLTFNGTLVHGVAQAGQNARLVFDTFGTGVYNSFVGRYARGTIATPSAVRAGDLMLRISANGYGSTGFAAAGSARIDFVADDDFTYTKRGTQIDFWTTPIGSTAITKNASVNNDGFVGTGIRFTGDDSYQTTAGIPLTAKAVTSATYVATLGIDGKLDSSQIPSSLTGAIVFKGTWNANSNTPTLSNTLPSGVEVGWEYVVDVGGTRDIGDGSKLFSSGDFVIFDGTHWKQVPSGNLFTSLTGGGHITVNQSTGAMVLGSDATPNSTTATIVSRDALGNFAANMITANLTGNVTGAVSGNAGSVTNGVYTTGNQSISGTKTFTSTIQGTATNATLAASVVGGVGVYTLTAGTGTAVSASSGTVTVWNTIPAFNTGTLVAQSVTAQSATTATNARIATTATNLAAATSILAGTLSVNPSALGKNAQATETYTVTGLTTNHKVIVMPQEALPAEFTITASWASDTNTLSIQYQTYGGGVDAAAFTIAYFAWV
jgi:hypothetical protein